MYRFEVYKDRKGGFRFRFRASNGEVMFGSESYTAKASVTKAIASIKEHAPGAETMDMTVTEKASARKSAEAKAAKPKTADAEA
jgi:uncharacterized protein